MIHGKRGPQKVMSQFEAAPLILHLAERVCNVRFRDLEIRNTFIRKNFICLRPQRLRLSKSPYEKHYGNVISNCFDDYLEIFQTYLRHVP